MSRVEALSEISNRIGSLNEVEAKEILTKLVDACDGEVFGAIGKVLSENNLLIRTRKCEECGDDMDVDGDGDVFCQLCDEIILELAI